MRAIVLSGGQYAVSGAPEPSAQPGEALIQVAYAGLNRADLLQKQGRYPSPEKHPAIPGMEVSGTVLKADAPGRFHVGDRVCALLTEGAFAGVVAAPAAHILPLPDCVSLEEGAALAEACFTVWISFVWQAKLKPGETILIHGGASGIGTIGIQVAQILGANVLATAGSAEKCAVVERLGATAIPYRECDFVATCRQATAGRGVDVILDMVGGDYFGRNLDALAHGGRMAVIALQKGAKVETSLGPILLKHLQITGSTLRSRPAREKARIAQELSAEVWTALAAGRLKPVIDRIFPLEQAMEALTRMDQGLNIGKILLKL